MYLLATLEGLQGLIKNRPDPELMAGQVRLFKDFIQGLRPATSQAVLRVEDRATVLEPDRHRDRREERRKRKDDKEGDREVDDANPSSAGASADQGSLVDRI